MALIKCPECGKEISDKAESCPNCGYSLKLEKERELQKRENKKTLIRIVEFLCIVFAVMAFLIMRGMGTSDGSLIEMLIGSWSLVPLLLIAIVVLLVIIAMKGKRK